MASQDSDLARRGGKGANLVRLYDAALPVPRFVIVETREYESFVATSSLEGVIAEALRLPPEHASVTIRDAFAAALLSAEQADRLLRLLAPLLTDGRPTEPVAVRSSATAEDLPGFSFAGQQDTFLEVATTDELLTRIGECWSSLWSERAISYRQRNAIGHDVSLAVVVQQMVDADASGVLFTANPRTGRRDEMVVEAVTGLGEDLVSGRVTPQEFALDGATGEIRSRQVVGSAPTPATGSATPLTCERLRELAALGRRVVEIYGEPMDIEWARLGDELFILQARPLTSLYPLPPPNARPHDEPEVWFSFGAFQGLLEPITPLGQDTIRVLLAGAAGIVGRRVDWRTSRFVQPAGERLWLRTDSLLRSRATRALAFRFLPYVEPSVAAILQRLADEPGLRPTRVAPPPGVAAPLAARLVRIGARTRAAGARAARARLDEACERVVADTRADVERARAKDSPQERLSALAEAVDAVAERAFPTLLPAFAPIMGPSMVLLHRLRGVAATTDLADADALALSVMRSLPGNVTTEMDLRLSDAAQEIRADPASAATFADATAEELAKRYRAGELPEVAQRELAAFLRDYGMRGVAEIDLGARRWRDDPTPVLHTLTAYLSMPTETLPRAIHQAGAKEAERSIRRIALAASPRKAQRVRRWAGTIRAMAGARETPKFTIVRCFGLLREGLDASAAELVDAGRLEHVSDIAFLRLDELPRAFLSDWRPVVRARQATWAAEARRGQVPRVLLEDGRAFFEGIGAGSGDLAGMGVSPGVAEGEVRVVRDPRTTTLRPGEILVCQGTDPAWTPLFLVAAGLVTEVGGLMTHGSVVAREYGIPAVVGVHEATTGLRDGQRIRIDGTSGVIELL